jgi:hypothetical protein
MRRDEPPWPIRSLSSPAYARGPARSWQHTPSWHRFSAPPRSMPEDSTRSLATAGYSYQALREENAPKVRRMSLLSGVLGVLMVVQTLAWLAALAVD